MIWLDKFQICIRVESYNLKSMAILVPLTEVYRLNYHIRTRSLQLPRIKNIYIKSMSVIGKFQTYSRRVVLVYIFILF